jgi:hypothetical protein
LTVKELAGWVVPCLKGGRPHFRQPG